MSSLSAAASEFRFRIDGTGQERGWSTATADSTRMILNSDYCGKFDTLANVNEHHYDYTLVEQISSNMNPETGRGDNEQPQLVSDTADQFISTCENVHGTRLQCTNNCFNISLDRIDPYLKGLLSFNMGSGYNLPSLVGPYYYYIPWKTDEKEQDDQRKQQYAMEELCQVHYTGDDFHSRNPKTMRAIYRNPVKILDDDPTVFYRFYYFCCPCMCKTWISPLFRAKNGCICRDCGQFVMPCGHIDSVTPYKGNESCYAKFECQVCTRNWSSKYSVANGWEKCSWCKANVFPFYQIAHSTLDKKLRKQNSAWKGKPCMGMGISDTKGVYKVNKESKDDWTKCEKMNFAADIETENDKRSDIQSDSPGITNTSGTVASADKIDLP